MTWIVGGLARQALTEVRGNDHPDLGRAVVDEPGQLPMASHPVQHVEVLAVPHGFEEAPGLRAARLIEDGRAHVLDVGVDGPAEDEEHGHGHDEGEDEGEHVPLEVNELLHDDADEA